MVWVEDTQRNQYLEQILMYVLTSSVCTLRAVLTVHAIYEGLLLQQIFPS